MTTGIEHWLEFYRHLFGYPLKRMSDNDLETDLNYVAREIVEARLQKEKDRKVQLTAWFKVLSDEKERRVILAKHGAPRYKGRDQVENVGQAVAYLKQYYTGATFEGLFQEITGFDIVPSSNTSRLRYRCTIHGSDTDPSGILYVDEGRYHCFGCGVGGDIFKLLMVWRQMSFLDAVRWLSARVPQYTKTEEGTWKRV